MTSGVAPAANGTMIFTSLVGQSCAAAKIVPAKIVPNRMANAATAVRFIVVMPSCLRFFRFPSPALPTYHARYCGTEARECCAGHTEVAGALEIRTDNGRA